MYIRLADSSGETAFVLVDANGDVIVRIRSDGEITGSWIVGSQGGALEAGNENVTIDYDGLRLVAPAAQNDRASIRFYAEEYNGEASYIRQDSGSDTGYADLMHLYTVLGSSGINLTSVRYQYYSGGSWYDGSLKIRMESVNPTAGNTGSYIELYGYRDASAQYGVILTPSEDATVGIKLDGDVAYTGDLRPVRGGTLYTGTILIDNGEATLASATTLTTSYQTLCTASITVPTGGGQLVVWGRVHVDQYTYGSTHVEARITVDGTQEDYTRVRAVDVNNIEYNLPLAYIGSVSAGSIDIDLDCRKNVSAGSLDATSSPRTVLFYALYA